MNRLITMTRNIAFAVVICGLPCLAKTPPGTLQVDVNNYVLYNYDTFDTTQFGVNPSATIVPMKTYNYHISIGDIVAVGGTPAKGTLLCTHTMFVLSPTATVGSMKAIADTSRAMMDDCSLEILASEGTAVGTIFIHGLFGGAPPPGAPPRLIGQSMAPVGEKLLHAYVEEAVEESSKGGQHAVIDRPPTVRSFPLTRP